jgi:hypothetical protein
MRRVFSIRKTLHMAEFPWRDLTTVHVTTRDVINNDLKDVNPRMANSTVLHFSGFGSLHEEVAFEANVRPIKVTITIAGPISEHLDVTKIVR